MNLRKVRIILSLLVACCLVIMGESNSQVSSPRQEKLCKQLLAAIKSGSQARVKGILDQGADVNCLGGDVYPLPEAVRRRNLFMVNFLLSRGAKINLGYEGENALMTSVGMDDLQMTKYLLGKGADPNSNEGSDLTGTHLMFAAGKGNLEIVKLLVQHGANVNSQISDGTTAMNLAKKKGHTAIVEFLERAGAKR